MSPPDGFLTGKIVHHMKTSRVMKSIFATAIAVLGASAGLAQAEGQKDREAFIQLYKDAGLSDRDSRMAAEKSWTFVNSAKFRELLNEMDDISKKQAKNLQRLEAMAGAARHIQKLAKEKGIDGKPTLEELGKQYPLALYSGNDIPWKFPEDIVKNLEWVNQKIKQGEKPYRDYNPEQKVSSAIRWAYENEYSRQTANASAAAWQSERDAQAAARASAWHVERLAYYKGLEQTWQAQYERDQADYAAYLDSWQSKQDANAYRRFVTLKLLSEPLGNSSAQYEIKAAENALIEQVWFSSHKSLLESTASTSYEWTAPNSPKAYESKPYYHPITSSSVLSQINSSAPAALAVGSAQQYTPGLMQIAQGALPGNVRTTEYVSINILKGGCTFTSSSGSCGAFGVSVGWNDKRQITASYMPSSPSAAPISPVTAHGLQIAFPTPWSTVPGVHVNQQHRAGVAFGIPGWGGRLTRGVLFTIQRFK
jgi:hypothetical protein